MGNRIGGAAADRRALRVREAVAAYRIGKTKLYALMNDGTLPSVKIRGTRLIPVDALEALIATGGVGSDPAIAAGVNPT